MRRILKVMLILIVSVMLSNVIYSKDKSYRNRNYIVKETKTITLKKSSKGYMLYLLKKGRYKIRILPNTVDFIDTYIVGNSTEINPEIEEDANIYEVDTNKEIEIFKQEYKVNRKHKGKIEIEKIE